MNDEQKKKPELKYPAMWGYRVIGLDEIALREAISDVLEGRDYTIDVSNTSSKGKYISLNVELVVHNEKERTGIFAALKKHPATHMIL